MNAFAGAVSNSMTTRPVGSQRCDMGGISLSVQPTSGFGTIEAECIEFRKLVQEALLRRHRDHHAAVDQQDWLAELEIPVSQGQPSPLERGDRKIRPLHEVE